MVTLSTTRGPWTANYGLHVNEFRREHTLDSGRRAGLRELRYEGRGQRLRQAALRRDARWHLYSDAQLRTTNFHYHGDVAIAPIRWTFFNPKIGARYDLSSTSGIYGSAGISTREPTRNDLFQGEDNASFAHDLHAVHPERVVDLEAGWDEHRGPLTVSANVYAMEFRHEIASTGELSDIGLLLRRNVDRSYRRGIELEYVWQAMPKLRLRGNASLSRNRIHTWTQFYDVYDAAGEHRREPADHVSRRQSGADADGDRQPDARVHRVVIGYRSTSPGVTSDARISTTRTTARSSRRRSQRLKPAARSLSRGTCVCAFT